MAILQAEVSEYRGPLPPPEILAAYNAIVPGGAERIFAVFEQQSSHRMSIEWLAISGDNRRAYMGLWFGLIVALTGLGVAGLLGYTGHDVASGVIAAVDLGGLVTAFIYGTNQRKQERQKKAERTSR